VTVMPYLVALLLLMLVFIFCPDLVMKIPNSMAL
jgi:hypothetical protein